VTAKGQDAAAASTGAAFLRYGGELRSFLMRRINRPQDAEDVVQEVFLRLLRMKNLDLLRKPRAYIHGIALHVVREFRMREMKAGTTLDPHEIVELAEHPTELRRDDLPEQLDIQRQLTSALRRLPIAHRTAFILHKRDGYSYEEIAEKLQVSVHAVDKYIVQAKVKIRTMEWDR
jgi:RNA polymerase sigma-70 factor (ECF subfamily)